MPSCMVLNHYKLNIWTLTLIWTRKLYAPREMIHTKMAKQHNVRWAFNASAWNPNADEILAASSYIQTEEKQRISKYVFQNDAKSSLVGRLMLRKFVHISTAIPYNEIRFGRDDHGKPYLLGAGDIPVSFNVSHQGDYVVLAGNTERNIGVDIMKIEPPTNKNIPEFFRLMKRQFSEHEWATIRRFTTEQEQIACFYRLWCLKESYVKNMGFGITVALNQISFTVKTPKLKMGEVINDTVLFEKNVLKQDWVFEETLLDDSHSVAVSLQIKDSSIHDPGTFEFLSFDEVVKEAKSLYNPDTNFANDFMKKQIKLF